MTFTEFTTMLQQLDIPVTYLKWPLLQEPSLPYIVYEIPTSTSDTSDNITWAEISDPQIELYTQERDFALESRIKALLTQYGIPFSTDAGYYESENMHQTTFYLQEVIDYGE